MSASEHKLNWVRELWRYEDGKLYWRKQPRPNHPIDISKPAGSLNKSKGSGYLMIKYKGRIYNRSRLVWYYFHNKWPDKQIDHINRNKVDDRIENLRDISPIGNSDNIDDKYKALSGYKYINKKKSKRYKQGFIWRFMLRTVGRKSPMKIVKHSTDLQPLIQFRNEYIEKYHPERLKYLNDTQSHSIDK